jgi:ParB family chromosome partitioning protein
MLLKDKRQALSRSILGLPDPPPAAGPAPAPAAPAASPVGIVGTALDLHREGLADKLTRLSGKLAQLEAERGEDAKQGDRLLWLEPDQVEDRLPADRDPGAFSDAGFSSLKASLAAHGQHVPVLVRPAPAGEGRYEIAAGRRRLAACRALGLPVLARVLLLDDEAMLALQYRENAEREDVSLLERGRWFVRLAEERGLSTTRIAGLVGLSQPMVVEYQKLGRLPRALLDRLADPRALTLAEGRRLAAALAAPEALAAMLAALETAGAGLSTRAQVGLALAAATGAAPAGNATQNAKHAPLPLLDADGRRVGVLTRSGAQWVCRFARDLDPEAVAFVAARIPELLAAWRQRG